MRWQDEGYNNPYIYVDIDVMGFMLPKNVL